MVRRSKKLKAGEAQRLEERCRTVIASIPPELYARALRYLYTQETKSSYAIEREAPDQKRAQKFADALREAAQRDYLLKEPLVTLQQAIVDPRFANQGWRDTNGVPSAISFAGERLRNLVVVRADDSQDLVVENGRIVGDTNRTFRIVTLNFMASGGDSYLPLTQGTNRIDLVPAGTSLTFNTDGGEQKALADYLRAIEVFQLADTASADDLRIQNLSRRGDMVLAPLVRRIEGPNPATRLTFRSLPGRTYAAESKESLDGTWVRLPVTTQGTGTLRDLVDERTPNDQRYYRVVVVQ